MEKDTVLQLLDIGLEGVSARKNPDNEWNYMFHVGIDSVYGLMVFVNETHGLIWTESGRIHGEDVTIKTEGLPGIHGANKGKKYPLDKLMEAILKHKEMHPRQFKSIHDNRISELKKEKQTYESYLEYMETGVGAKKMYSKMLKEVKQELDKYLNNPKIK